MCLTEPQVEAEAELSIGGEGDVRTYVEQTQLVYVQPRLSKRRLTVNDICDSILQKDFVRDGLCTFNENVSAPCFRYSKHASIHSCQRLALFQPRRISGETLDNMVLYANITDALVATQS